MISEIYSLLPGDSSYDSTTFELHNERDLLLSQIKMVLDTDNGDVIGDPNVGMSLEDLLFEFNLNEAQLKKKITDQINAYCDPTPNFQVTADVRFFRGSIRDGAIIDIYINQQKSLGILIK